ncbi:MAG: hypothetical protein S4CHLAM2_10740 [Chlamydiales bacterium]|nr:hypothetical protein [Chlamydiales bacterium]
MQIRRYSNRIEFENAGYSLKPEDQLGLPGSIARNTKIATILHDVNLAETKGTGIRAMRDSMREANLTVPLIESKRASNQFILTLLTHHLMDQEDVKWLARFKECNLSDEEARALVVIREMGAFSNADYRAINTVDTLSASNSLRRLRDLGLIEQKGSGSKTYYTPSKSMLGMRDRTPDIREGTPDIREGTPDIREGTPDIREGTPDIREGTPDISRLLEEGIEIPEELLEELRTFGKRASKEKTHAIIKQICALAYIKPTDLGALLSRNPEHLRNRFLTPMVESGELELKYPNNVGHPQQAYRLVI